MSSESLIIICLVIFLIPTIIAFKKEHPYKIGILITNTLGSLFFGAGWVIALIWSVSKPKDQKIILKSSLDEIEKLNELREKGILTENEFTIKKEAILKN